MHVCFHGGGGGGDGRVAKSISVISDFAKILIGRGGGDHARAQRRRQMRRCKDAAPAAAAAAAAASASSKIAPAQLQEEEEEGEGGGGGKEEEFCDKCCSALSGAGGAEEETVTAAEGDREWVAEPEPGVLLTLAPRADGVTNRLRRIRFREEVFDAWAAQCWWADNHDRIAELYSLVQPDDDTDADEEAAAEAAMLPVTPCQSEAEEEDDDGAAGAESSSRSPSTSTFSGGPSSGSGGGSTGTLGSPILGLVTNTGAVAAAAEHDAIRDQHQPTAAPWREWVEEYEPGVFITVEAYPGHRLQLRCVKLSREMFGEVKARVWWEENKARLHHLYSF